MYILLHFQYTKSPNFLFFISDYDRNTAVVISIFFNIMYISSNANNKRNYYDASSSNSNSNSNSNSKRVKSHESSPKSIEVDVGCTIVTPCQCPSDFLINPVTSVTNQIWEEIECFRDVMLSLITRNPNKRYLNLLSTMKKHLSGKLLFVFSWY